jgi:tetratricopeptide (TPR) repeat protein
MLLLKKQFSLMASRFEEAGDFFKALDTWKKCIDIADRQEVPVLQQHLSRLQDRQDAHILWRQAQQLISSGDIKNARLLKEKAKKLDPSLDQNSSPQENIAADDTMHKARVELERSLVQDKKAATLQEEQTLIEKVRRQTEHEGKSSLSQESGSIVKRVTQQVTTEEEKTTLTRQVNKKTVSLHEQDTPQTEQVVQMVIEKENIGERVHTVLTELMEGKRKAQSVTFKRNLENDDAYSLAVIASLHREKIDAFLRRRTQEMSTKHGVSISLSSEDRNRLMQQTI